MNSHGCSHFGFTAVLKGETCDTKNFFPLCQIFIKLFLIYRNLYIFYSRNQHFMVSWKCIHMLTAGNVSFVKLNKYVYSSIFFYFFKSLHSPLDDFSSWSVQTFTPNESYVILYIWFLYVIMLAFQDGGLLLTFFLVSVLYVDGQFLLCTLKH